MRSHLQLGNASEYNKERPSVSVQTVGLAKRCVLPSAVHAPPLAQILMRVASGCVQLAPQVVICAAHQAPLKSHWLRFSCDETETALSVREKSQGHRLIG